MKLRPGRDVDAFMELSMKAGSWETKGIPERGSWIRNRSFGEIVKRGSEFSPDDLILGLMDWLDVTDNPLPAIVTLRQLLDRHYPSDGRREATCHFVDERGVDRRFLVGLIDTTADVVTWQRDSVVFGLGQPSSKEPGRLVIAAPHPLPLTAALRVLALAQLMFMDAPFDSFHGAVTMSSATSNFYASDRGELTTCHWPHGLGIQKRGGSLIDAGAELHPLPGEGWLAPNQIAMMVAVAAGYLAWR